VGRATGDCAAQEACDTTKVWLAMEIVGAVNARAT
jgi:hypothetical protein